MVYEGAFERYPNLKMFAIEGGSEWMGPLMWRLDRQWEELGAEVKLLTPPVRGDARARPLRDPADLRAEAAPEPDARSSSGAVPTT